MDENRTEVVTVEVEELVMGNPGDESDKLKRAHGLGNTERGKWHVPVDVYLISVDPLEFHVESPIQSAPDTDLIFHNNRHPGFEIMFNLHDQTGDPNGYSFVRPKEDAIWSQMGSGPACCPKAAVPDSDRVLIPQSLTQDAMTLVVTNENVAPKVGPFQYTLRVTNGNDPVPLDPGGNNMNGATNAR